MNRPRLARILVVAGTLLLSAACDTLPEEVDYGIPHVQDPTSGPLIWIESVKDEREFVSGPIDHPTPSLSRPEALDDRAVTSRVIGGRYDQSSGRVEADLHLVQGKTVEGLVHELAAAALREAGYRVASPGQAEHDGAQPLTVAIEKLWIGDDHYALCFEARLRFAGPALPFSNAGVVEHVRNKHLPLAVGKDGWQPWLDVNLTELRQEAVRSLARRAPER